MSMNDNEKLFESVLREDRLTEMRDMQDLSWDEMIDEISQSNKIRHFQLVPDASISFGLSAAGKFDISGDSLLTITAKGGSFVFTISENRVSSIRKGGDSIYYIQLSDFKMKVVLS